MVPTERQLQEAVARCVSIMVFYNAIPDRMAKQNGRMAKEDQLVAGWMANEVQDIGGWVADMGLERDQAEELILRPVEVELIARFGDEIGLRLNRLFLEAFEGTISRGGTSS